MDNSSIKISRGHPKLGATVDPSGTNFAVFSRNGKRVFIELYENFYDDIPFFSYELDRIYNKTGDIWHIYLFGIGNNLYYLWRVDGDYEPLSGHRFNKNKVYLIHMLKLYRVCMILMIRPCIVTILQMIQTWI